MCKEKNLLSDLKLVLKYIIQICDIVSRKKIIFIFILFTIETIMNLFQPYIVGMIMDNIHTKKVIDIKINILLMTTIFILSIIITYVMRVLLINIVVMIEKNIKQRLLKSTINMEYCTLKKTDKSKILNTIEADSMIVSNLISQNIEIIVGIGTLFFTGILLFYIQPILTLIEILIFPINIFVFSKSGKLVKDKESILRIENDKLVTFLIETLNSVSIFTIYNIKQKRLNHYEKLNTQIYDIGIGKEKIEIKTNIIVSIFSYISQILVILVGIKLIYNNKLTIGLLIAFNSYSSIFKENLKNLASLNFYLQSVSVSISRIENIFEILKNNEENDLFKSQKSDNTNIKKINIYNLNIYTGLDKTRCIVKNKNYEFLKGYVYILQGESGSGKTTLLDIISGLNKNYSANICVNDSIYESYIPYNVSYVMQDNYIYTDTIYNNISMYRDIDKSIVKDVCNRLNIDAAIEKLPKGYETILNNDGVSLSGGELQRLCIARSMVMQSEIYLFDESISSLDKENYRRVLKILDEISKNSIVILATHIDINEVEKYISNLEVYKI